MPNIISIEPQFGSTSGGETVKLTLSKPLPKFDHTIFVKFGTILTRASSFSGSEITVVTPPHSVGRIIVKISSNQKNWNKKSVHFEYIQTGDQNNSQAGLLPKPLLIAIFVIAVVIFVMIKKSKRKSRSSRKRNTPKNAPLAFQRDDSPREDNEKAPFIPKKREHAD